MPSISRLVLSTVPLEPEHAPPLPIGNSVEAFPVIPRTEDEVTLDRVMRAKPSLVLPDHLATPAAKLLYVATHRQLSAGLAPLCVRIGMNDHVRLQADGGLSLSSPGKPTLHLNNRHDDLAQLLDGAHVFEASSIDALLQEAVHRFYTAGQFDGGGAAANERGERAFTFATIQQVLVSPDPLQPGLECLASAAVHQWKSAGLVPPGLRREEFEHRYTSIHGERGGVRLGPEFNKTLRGGRSQTRIDAAATAAFANALREDDWAKLTGAASGRYFVRTLPSIDAVVKHFEGGGAGVRSTWADGGHYFVLSGAKKEHGEIFVNEDDSLRGSPALRERETDEPYRTQYDERNHTRFWTLDRS